MKLTKQTHNTNNVKKNNYNCILFTDTTKDNSMDHTLNISFIKILDNDMADGLCGFKIQDYLQQHNVIVSTGSACNTSNKQTILEYMNVPK